MAGVELQPLDAPEVRVTTDPAPARSIVPLKRDAFAVRGAVLEDAPAIATLIESHAVNGGTLRRDLTEVCASIGEFVVAEGPALESGEHARPWIAANAALVVFSPALAEIRSVAVDPRAQGAGLGRAVVERLVAEAVGMEIDRVVLLTKTPAFFAKCGFTEIDQAFLPVEFIEEAIVSRGRTCVGRSIMLRSLS